MRIAVFTDTYLPEINGITTSLKNSISLLSKKHDFCIFAPTYPGIYSGIAAHVQKNVQYHRIPSLEVPTYKHARFVLPDSSITNVCCSFNPDIIHIHTPSTLGWYGVRCARLFKKPVVGTFHTLISEMLHYTTFSRRQVADTSSRKKIVWWWLKKIYNQCDLITAPTPSIKLELKKKGILVPIEVISNGLMLEKYPVKKTYHLTSTLIHHGRLAYEKNIDVLLTMMAILVKKHPRLTLKIIGHGPAEQKLRDECRVLNLTNNVHFLGFLEDKQLYSHLNKADLFVTASTIETQGIAVLEAMAVGLPIVAVNKYGLIDLVETQKNGFLVSEHNPLEMTHAVEMLLHSQALRKKYGVCSRKKAQFHNLTAVVKKWETLYFKLTKCEKFK